MLEGKKYNFSCDIYSIGALMYVLTSARLPFWDDDRRERKQKVCNEALDLEADSATAVLSQSAKDLISGMLAKNPAERLSIKDVLAHPWLQ